LHHSFKLLAYFFLCQFLHSYFRLGLFPKGRFPEKIKAFFLVILHSQVECCHTFIFVIHINISLEKPLDHFLSAFFSTNMEERPPIWVSFFQIYVSNEQIKEFQVIGVRHEVKHRRHFTSAKARIRSFLEQ
jgi:hypothetical protein